MPATVVFAVIPATVLFAVIPATVLFAVIPATGGSPESLGFKRGRIPDALRLPG
jgi:hypothetical protein